MWVSSGGFVVAFDDDDECECACVCICVDSVPGGLPV